MMNHASCGPVSEVRPCTVFEPAFSKAAGQPGLHFECSAARPAFTDSRMIWRNLGCEVGIVCANVVPALAAASASTVRLTRVLCMDLPLLRGARSDGRRPRNAERFAGRSS
jgi:hypothetical protein